MPETSRNLRWLGILFLFAVSVRLFRVDWDQHHFFHPDERAIGFAVDRLSLKPLQLNPHFFAYGSLTLYVIKGATSILGNFHQALRGYDSSIFAGRVISALLGALTAVVLAMLGTRLYGQAVGLLAGFLMAMAVTHVQNSHFATSDVPLTLLVLCTLYFLVRILDTGRIRHYWLAGLFAGLAIATKFSALPIALPIGLTLLYRWWVVEKRAPRVIGRGAMLGLLVAVGFFLGQPYAVLDFPAFRNDILEQSRMVRNAGMFPYTNQYIGVPKYLYDLGQMVVWGMGPLLGIAVLAGTGLAIRNAVRQRRMAEIVLLSWALPFFLITGSFDVKFPRYLLPIYPLVILWGAAMLRGLGERSRAGRAVLIAVEIATILWLFAFIRIYTRPHTIVTASEWFYKHVPARTKVASQHWDEGFPFPLPGDRNPDRYQINNLPYYEQDTPEKLAGICRDLAASEYAVFQTKRIYGSVTRAPEKFPLMTKYFSALFSGDLGFTLTNEFASRPALFGIQVPDELADESFSVYDHPKAIVFRNTEHLSAAVIQHRVMSATRRLSRREILLARPGKNLVGTEEVEEEQPAAAEPASPAPAAPPPAAAQAPAGQAPAPQVTASPGKLEQPRGVAVTAKGDVLVCDFGHERIQRFDSALAPLAAWGRQGTGPGEFKQPGALAIGSKGEVYVADTWNSRVQVFDDGGKFLREWKSEFFAPRGIAVGPDDTVFVADTGNHRIVRFGSNGAKQAEWGGRGEAPGKLFDPIGVAVGPGEKVYVCDNGNGRMQIFDKNGQLQKAFPVAGWRREVFSEPQAAAASDGSVWVTVPLEKEVRHYAADGKLLRTIKSGESSEAAWDKPMGICLAPSGDALYVTDLAGAVLRLKIP